MAYKVRLGATRQTVSNYKTITSVEDEIIASDSLEIATLIENPLVLVSWDEIGETYTYTLKIYENDILIQTEVINNLTNFIYYTGVATKSYYITVQGNDPQATGVKFTMTVSYDDIAGGTYYTLKEGYTLKEILDETLDSGMLAVPQTSEILVEPLDIALIYNDATIINKMLVGDFVENIASFLPTLKYNYILNLISPTIVLQNITLPNLAITQPLTGTKRTISYHLNRILDVYLDSDYYFDASLLALTNDVVCPEYQFNKSNVWEVMNKLLEKLNCVVKVIIDNANRFKISYLNINQRNNEIDISKINNISSYYSLADYASELDIEAENALYPLQEDQDTFIRSTIRTTVRCSSNYQLTDENQEIVLPSPIYRLEKVEVELVYKPTSITSAYYKGDITSYILEKKQYDSLYENVYSGASAPYKITSLYYTEGSNVIGGLGLYVSATVRAIRQILIAKILIDDGVLLDSFDTDYKKMLYTVTYVTLGNARIKTSKTIPTKNKRVLFNNQADSFVDVKALGEKEVQNVNRLGNKQKTIFGRYTLTDTLPVLGDYYGDYILSTRELKYNDNFVLLKGELSKNYVNKVSYTGISFKKRITSIASASEALFRHELIKKYMQFSFSYILTSDYAKYQLTTLTNGDSIKLITAKTDVIDYNISMPFTKYVNGNSIEMSFRFIDNYSAGLQVYDIGNGIQKQVTYVDNNGEFKNILIKLYSDYSDYANIAFSGPIYLIDQYADSFSSQHPIIDDDMVDESYLVHSIQKTLYKDNREIIGITLQDEYCSDTTDIIVGPMWMERNVLVNLSTEAIKIWASTTETYEANYKGLAKGTQTELTYTIINNHITVETETSWLSWAIADSSGNIYLAINGNTGTIYLNERSSI